MFFFKDYKECFIMKSMKILIVLSLFSSLTWAQSVKVLVSLSPAGSFEAVSGEVRGKVQKDGAGFKAANIFVAVKSLKTQLDLRDEHLHKKLEADKYPRVLVKKAIAKDGKGVALMQIMSKEIKVPFTYKESGDKVSLEMKLPLKDLQLTGISYMGIGVKEVVVITADLPVGGA
jgi:Flp pilus assembly protein CpaB